MFPHITLLMFLVLVTGCDFETVRTGIEADGKTVRVSRGARLAVELPSNPSTGYRWRITEFPEHLLEADGEPVFKAGASSMPGAGGIETLSFRVLRRDSGVLKMEYSRPWEHEIAPAKIFAITIESR